LNLQNVSDVADVVNSSVTWKLTPTEIRTILLKRKDFPSEDLQKLLLDKSEIGGT